MSQPRPAEAAATKNVPGNASAPSFGPPPGPQSHETLPACEQACPKQREPNRSASPPHAGRRMPGAGGGGPQGVLPAADPTAAGRAVTAPPGGPSPAPTRQGGPKTPEGKRRSRANALTHGGYAKTLLPEVLGPEVVNYYIDLYWNEYDPQTPLETHYVWELAQRAAQVERLLGIEEAAMRQGADAALQLAAFCPRPGGPGGGTGLTATDIMLAGAVNRNIMDPLTRARRIHELAFQEKRRVLMELQQKRLAPAEPAAEVSPLHRSRPIAATRFPDNESCVTYLTEWARRQPFRCPQCKHDQAKWIRVRGPEESRWKCARCRRQVRIREGTVLAGSHVPLRAWFLAIECLLRHSDATTAEVAEATGIGRPETVRCVAKKIRAAFASPEVSRRLAGLDAVFLNLAFRPPPPPGAAWGPAPQLDAEPDTDAVARPGVAPVTEPFETPPDQASPDAAGPNAPSSMVPA